MVEGPTIMLGVFITLLYTHTMPNIYYCSTCMLCYTPTWWPNIAWEVAENSRIFPWYLRHETCQHGAVKVWWRALQSCWECSSLCYTPIQCQTSTIVAPACCYTPTWWPNLPWEVGRKSRFFPDLRHETRQHGAVKVWWRALQSCWECSSLCYTPIQCQTTTIVAPACCAIPPLDGQTLPEKWQKIQGFFPDLRHETRQHGAVKVWWRALQSCWECSSLCYTPIQCQTSTIVAPACCYTPTWWPNLPWEVGRKSRFFPDLRHETRQHGAVKVWWRALQSCWECSSLCYTPIQCQTSTIVAPACCAIPPLDGQTLPEKWQKIRDFFLIWGMKPANMGL